MTGNRDIWLKVSTTDQQSWHNSNSYEEIKKKINMVAKEKKREEKLNMNSKNNNSQ